MDMLLSSTTVTLLVCAGAMLVLLAAVWRLVEVSRPDEWLLLIRNGRLVRSGVGIYLIRRPGDVVARFTATVQRVRYVARALTRDRLPVMVEGFLLWAVAEEGDSPFRAFSKLGIVNLADMDAPKDASRKHLLTTPQHHAFQQLLAAAAQRRAAAHDLHQLLGQQDDFVADLRQHLTGTTGELGISLQDLQILSIQPADAQVLEQLGARPSEALRQEAALTRQQAEDQIQRHEAELSAHRLEQQHEHELRAVELKRQQKLATEQADRELWAQQRQREVEQLTARLDARRAEAQAEQDAMLLLVEAEEKKSAAVREYELARLATELMAEALERLPLRDIQWISMDGDSPLAGIAGLVAGADRMVKRLSN